MKVSLFIFSLFLAQTSLFGQGREQTLEEVSASDKKQEKLQSVTLLDKKDLQELQPTDVGDALTHIPGIALKNYGGLGGLKTFSFRGIGSEHNTVLEDGFVLSNAQMGQVNLGSQMATNLESIEFSSQTKRTLLPVTAYLSATNLILTTRLNQITSKKIAMNSQVKLGSFGQVEPHIGGSKKWTKWSIGGYGRFLHFQGNYGYTLGTTSFPITGVRKNNELTNFSSGITLQYEPDSSKLHRLFLHQQSVDQGLPGAVIYYQNLTNQFLAQNNQQINYDFTKQTTKKQLRVYTSFQSGKTLYTDENFQNSSGYLRNVYDQFSSSTGIVSDRPFLDNWRVNYGLEGSYQQLKETRNLSADSSLKLPNVYRTQVPFFIQFIRKGKLSSFQVKAAYQLIKEARLGTKIKALPTAGLDYSVWTENKKWGLHFLSGYSHRLPSFSELYFGSSFNADLKNEDAFQNSLDFSRFLENDRHSLYVSAGIYYNRIWNKIVATPNKNLFQWTILNVGIVNAFGDEFKLDYLWKIGRTQRWKLELHGAYNNQLVLDADPTSINVGQQIAYVPFQTITSSAALRYKVSGVRLDFFWSDFRYALNQNTVANLLPGFHFFDLAVFHKIRTKKDHYIRAQFSLKNVLNSSYYFVRNYPMPGLNFLMTLSYEI